MSRAAGLLVAVFTTVLLGLTAARADNRVALIIGNEAYRHMPTLSNPVRDATDVAKALRDLGFDTIVVTNADLGDLDRAIATFSQKVSQADIALFYFSGHGMQFQGKNYLLPVEADLTSASDVNRFRLLQVDDVIDVLGAAPGMKLIVLDACRTNAAERDFKNRIASVPGAGRDGIMTRGFARIPPRSGLIVAYATQSDDVANDGSGLHSPFTTAFLDNVASPNIEVRQMLSKVQSEVFTVTKQTEHPQLPEIASLYVGPDMFLKRDDSTSASESRPAPDEVAWGFVRATTDLASLRQFVAQFPNSGHRGEANRRIAELTSRDDRPKPSAPPSSADQLAAISPHTPAPHRDGENCASRSTTAGTDRYCASSMLPAEFGNSYRVQNLFTGGSAVAWVEGKPGEGIGESITVEFDGRRKVQGVRFDNGYQKNSDIYYKNSRVKSVRLVFSSGDRFDFPIRDTFGTQTLNLPHPVNAYWMQLVIEDTYRGSKYSDTAISKLFIDSESLQ